MNNPNLRLYIDEGLHITRPKKRIEAIEEALGEVDVVFVEAPRSDSPGLKTKIANFLLTPLLLAVIYLWVFTLTVLGALTGAEDEKIVTHLTDKHGAELVRTDRNVHRILKESRRLWTIGHLVMVTLAVYAFPEVVDHLLTFSPLWIQKLTLGLFTGLGLFALFLAGTLGSRNAKMARDIGEYAENQSDETACLITGGYHASGTKRILKENPNITLVEESE